MVDRMVPEAVRAPLVETVTVPPAPRAKLPKTRSTAFVIAMGAITVALASADAPTAKLLDAPKVPMAMTEARAA